MKARALVKIISLSVAIALLAGCVAAGAAYGASEDEAPRLGIAVETSFLQRTTIRNELTYIGQTQPLKTVNIASLLAAEVTSVNFNIGDPVEEGDVLFTVDAQDIQNQMRTLQAAVAQTNVAIDQANYGLQVAIEGNLQQRITELQLEQAVRQSYFGAQQADVQLRGSNIQVRGLRDALDDAESDLGQARARRDAAQAGLPAALANLTAAQGSHDAARENLAGAVADLIQMEQDLITYGPSPGALLEIAYQARVVERARESVEIARSEVDRLEGVVSGAQSAIIAAEGGIRAASGAITSVEAQLDAAANARRGAGIGREMAGANLGSAIEIYYATIAAAEQAQERGIVQAEFGVRSAQAQLESTLAQLHIAQSNLNRASITSPISGVVSARNVEVGQFVSQAVMPFAIVQLDPVIVQVSVAETLINLVYLGQEVDVAIQALGSDQTFTGTVTTISPVANHASTFPVRIELPNPDGQIRPGMFSQVTFVQAQSANTFVVPRNVVLSDEIGRFVFVVDQDGYARRTTVTTGLESGNQIEILSGVTGRDQIVMVGQEFLYDGTFVNVVAVDGQRVSG